MDSRADRHSRAARREWQPMQGIFARLLRSADSTGLFERQIFYRGTFFGLPAMRARNRDARKVCWKRID
jgi:hypothetical protein